MFLSFSLRNIYVQQLSYISAGVDDLDLVKHVHGFVDQLSNGYDFGHFFSDIYK